MRIVIIGAGPCGLGAAHRLHELGHDNFCVYDRNPYVGGLATSFIDDKGFTWDLAVHVAHSHYHYIDRLMESLLPDGFFHHVRKSWVREYGVFVPYPFQYNVRHLPAAAREECVAGLAALATRAAGAAPRTFKEWILATAGEGIAKHFMFPYNKKLWTVDPAEMGWQWIGDRVPATDLERVRRNIAEAKDDVSWGPNSTFQFPKQGGTGAIWKALAARLPAERIRLSTAVERIDPRSREIAFSDGTTETYDALISTMPLTRLTALCGNPPLHRRATQLRHNVVHVVGVAPNQPLPESLRDKTWIYCPEDQCNFYRVTPFSLFSPNHVPDPDRWCSLLCEVASVPGAEVDTRKLVADTMRGLRDTGLIDVDPATAHIHLMKAEFGYPIPTPDRDDILGDVLPALEAMNIYSRGRFGGWKYEVANMDHSVMQGVEAVDRLLNGTAEVTLPTPHLANAGKR
ncbi:MAG TPA: FAD-dependent oxidoreductase [Kiritimatiellia bacterium]|jgi:protoporphyrinogen oxidase